MLAAGTQRLLKFLDRPQIFDDLISQLFDRFFTSQPNFRILGRFIRRVDSCQAFEFAGAGFLIKAFGVSRFADCQRRIHEHFYKIASIARCGDGRPDSFPVNAVGAYERGEDNRPGRTENFCDAADAPYVFFPVLGGKTQPESLGKLMSVDRFEQCGTGIQSVSDVVTVEHETLDFHGVQFCVNAIGNRAFAAATEAGKPDDASARAMNAVSVPGYESFFGHRV